MSTTNPEPSPTTETDRAFGRRGLLQGAVAGAAGLVAGFAAGSAVDSSSTATEPPAHTGRAGCRYVIRGGTVLTMDDRIGDFAVADVLVEGTRIVEVRPDVDAPGVAEIDARGRIVVPGFVDTHHHQFETALRGSLPNALLFDDGSGSPSAQPSYLERVLQTMAPAYTPNDVLISSLVAGLSQLDAGVTSVLDVSQIHHTPEHSDAAVEALRSAGRRSVLGYAEGDGRAGTSYPDDARRLRGSAFASSSGLLTMAMGGEVHLEPELLTRTWRLGRELDLPIVTHAVSSSGVSPALERIARGQGGASGDLAFGPDVLLIHMTGMPEVVWNAVRDAGVSVSVAFPIEMAMRHGEPPILTMQRLGIEPSLSSDVETTMAADSFTQMRSGLTMQRMLVNQAVLEQGAFAPPSAYPTPSPSLPELLLARDVLRFATIVGARHLRLGDRVGSITPGKEADLVLLDATALNVAPVNTAVGAVVSLMDRTNVETVIVGGAVRKWRGRLLDVDWPTLRGRLERSRSRLLERTGVRVDLLA